MTVCLIFNQILVTTEHSLLLLLVFDEVMFGVCLMRYED